MAFHGPAVQWMRKIALLTLKARCSTGARGSGIRGSTTGSSANGLLVD